MISIGSPVDTSTTYFSLSCSLGAPHSRYCAVVQVACFIFATISIVQHSHGNRHIACIQLPFTRHARVRGTRPPWRLGTPRHLSTSWIKQLQLRAKQHKTVNMVLSKGASGRRTKREKKRRREGEENKKNRGRKKITRREEEEMRNERPETRGAWSESGGIHSNVMTTQLQSAWLHADG